MPGVLLVMKYVSTNVDNKFARSETHQGCLYAVPTHSISRISSSKMRGTISILYFSDTIYPEVKRDERTNINGKKD